MRAVILLRTALLCIGGFCFGWVIWDVIHPVSHAVYAAPSLAIIHVCDERGVCCYERYEREFSCVATRVEISNLVPEGVTKKDGEVNRRTMEERVLRNSESAFNLDPGKN